MKAVFVSARAGAKPADILYRLMLEMDKHEEFDEHPIRESEPYRQAVKGLGWDIDWGRERE